MSEIRNHNKQINIIMEKPEIIVYDEQYYNDELDNQAEYLLELGFK